METQDAVERLENAQAAGLLYVITNEHNCGGGVHPNAVNRATGEKYSFDPAVCAAHETPTTDPRHFVCKPVVRVEGPNERGLMKAFTEDGDWTVGAPEALLPRLLEYALSSG